MTEPTFNPDGTDYGVLLEMVRMADTRPWRISSRLIDFARPERLPEDRDSANPIRRVAGWAGCKIQDRLMVIARARAAS